MRVRLKRWEEIVLLLGAVIYAAPYALLSQIDEAGTCAWGEAARRFFIALPIALAVLALLEPVSGIALPLNRFTAFIAAVLGVPGVILLLLLQLIL